MVFCCIAIVAIAIIYFIVLWIRQLFLGRRRDNAYASWEPPPRALAGNGAWPVYGHTRLFRRHVGDVALLFDPEWTEFGRFSKRQLGDCFAIFIWGQWRIGIQGPERAQQFLENQMLHEGWPWTPPITLLGKSCIACLQQDDPVQAQGLRALLQEPLCNNIQRFAPFFAHAAEQCLEQVAQGVFRKTPRKRRSTTTTTPKHQQPSSTPSPNIEQEEELEEEEDDELNEAEKEEGICCKLKWEALRSYSLDVFDGSLFQMNLWKHQKNNNDDEPTHEQSLESNVEPMNVTHVKKKKDEEPPSRELMLRWMERIKLGLDVIKLTFGPEWMYVWMLNEYGRAVNARIYVEKLLREHIAQMVDLVPQVTHEPGHVYHEPTTRPFPLLALRDNLIRSKEGIFGDYTVYQDATLSFKEASIGCRKRCNSMPHGSLNFAVAPSPRSGSDEGCLAVSPYIQPFKTEQDLARHDYENSPMRRQRVNLRRIESGAEEMDEQPCTSPRDISLSPSSQEEWLTSPVPCWESCNMSFRLPFYNTTDISGKTVNRSDPVIQKTKIRWTDSTSDGRRNQGTSSRSELTETHEKETKRKSKESDAIQDNQEEKKDMKTNRKCARPIIIETNSHIELESPQIQTKVSPYNGSTTYQTPRNSTGRQHKKLRNSCGPKKRSVTSMSNEKVCSLLETLLQQRGPEGKGISQTILMELSINLWMMLEVGNAWTAMALHLLAWDELALSTIQKELDVLEMECGSDLFTPETLDRMKFLDALIYESIRLLPPFLGGLKSTTETVILKDAGVQIPKGSHIFFCQPSEQEFDLFAAVGKRPECLGQRYPCVELFGFLPLQGLEVPLMVLQCKVFLIVTLRNYSPSVWKRNTFIRRVKSAVSLRKSNTSHTPDGSFHSVMMNSDRGGGDPETRSNYSNEGWDIEDGMNPTSHRKMTPSEAMKHFTKIPFPEPKRVIRLKPRGL